MSGLKARFSVWSRENLLGQDLSQHFLTRKPKIMYLMGIDSQKNPNMLHLYIQIRQLIFTVKNPNIRTKPNFWWLDPGRGWKLCSAPPP